MWTSRTPELWSLGLWSPMMRLAVILSLCSVTVACGSAALCSSCIYACLSNAILPNRLYQLIRLPRVGVIATKTSSRENSFFQGNAVFQASLNLESQREIKAATVGDLAYRLRQTLVEQGTKAELEKYAYAFRKGIVERNYVSNLASPFPRFIIASSFSAARFFEESDISAALSNARNNSEPLFQLSCWRTSSARCPAAGTTES
jgi:hypothetical protein